jgi:TrmH family RNA methyltransferase
MTHADRKRYAALHRARGRRQQEAFLLEGTRSLHAALDAAADVLDALLAPSADTDLRARLAAAGIPILDATESDVAAAADVQTHQGAVARVRLPSPDQAALSRAERLLVLNGVQDPGNVGTLVRTAAWFGLDAVVADRDTADFWAPKTVRSTMGGLFDLALVRLDDLPGFLREQIATGREVAGAALGGPSVDEWVPARRSALAMGSEGGGFSADVDALLGQRVHIPGSSRRRGTESLNVAVAGGIAMARMARAARVS